MSRFSSNGSDDDALYLLLDRYLAGQASADEADAVHAWLAEDPGHVQVLEDLRLIRRVAAERPPESSVDVAWEKAVEELELHGQPASTDMGEAVVHRIPGRPSALPPTLLDPRPRRPLLTPGRVAAAAATVMIGGLLLWQARHPMGGTSDEPVWQAGDYVTQPAQRSDVTLSDGTQLILAPDSRLRVAADFGASRRDLYLEGEAYFDVAHDADRPFSVHTRGSVAEDLGTAFLVRAYPEQAGTEVVVTEGRVALQRADAAASRRAEPPPLLLAAGDLGRLDAEGLASVERGVDVNRYLAWTRGILAFDDMPLGEVVVNLERWYGVEVRLAESALATQHLTLTARFHEEPVSQVLQRISLTLGLGVERDDRSFVLSGR